MRATLAIGLLAALQQVSAYGCATHTYGHCSDGITHWYDPDDGEICDPLDCGGGQAPAKSNVPCCPAYTGTSACVTTPSYMPCFQQLVAATSAAPAPTSPVSTSTTEAPAPVQPSTTPAAPAQTSVLTAHQTMMMSSSPSSSWGAQLTSTTSSVAAVMTLSTTMLPVSSKVASSSISSHITSSTTTTKASSSSTSTSAVALQTSNAADLVQREAVVVYLGLAVGLVAAL